MRRIMIVEDAGSWCFEWEGGVVRADTPLLAGLQAKALGDALEGKAVGYIVRLETRQGSVTLHAVVFGTEQRAREALTAQERREAVPPLRLVPSRTE